MNNSIISNNPYAEDNSFKSFRNLQYRFLIPQPAAGAIISKKGETIKRLRATYSCDISVPPSNGPERLMIINTDIDKLCGVLSEIFEIVKDCMHSKINDPKDIINGIMPDGMLSPDMDLRFLVSENVCGAIIGKGGEVIRKLTETYRVSVIKVYQQMCPSSTDRVIRLVGLPEDILSCLRAIHDVIASLKDTRSPREYDPNNFNEMHAVNYGGWMSLEARRHIARMGGPAPPTKGQTESGRNQSIIADLYGSAMSPASMVFTPGMTLGEMSDRLLAENILMDMGQEQMYGAPVATPLMPQLSMGSQGGPIEVSHVSLPNKLIGAIMGKGGSRINEIREETGARIDVDKTMMDNKSSERIITIQGSRDQIQNAQFLLQACVRKYGGKHF
uniref:Heterogeneous nuclear ribonucleoprotein K n=1 Tax=Schmidtea mediterranea TaxID=79327 RepID=A0A023ZS14_SCHMD|nr:heterogeneous nuclear ribonucleoprotein K [Schmidtea mediterranea]